MAPGVAIAEEQRPTVRKVLLVDDHEMYLKYCTREFVRAGVAVCTASTLSDALYLAREERPDVAIVDLFLAPPESGLAVIRALKERDPHLFCILVSAHMSVSNAMMGVRAGADDVLVKPFGARHVITRVERGPLDRPIEAPPTLYQMEWEHISRALHDHDGNISHAAESLGIFRQSLQRKIHKHAPRALGVPDEGPYPVPPPPLPPEPKLAAPPPRKKRSRPIKRRRH
jgi:two-component system response regulator RegA